MERDMVRNGEIYRHFKGNLYQIIANAVHTETEEMMVVYQALYGNFKVFVRPLSSFLDEVDIVKYPDSGQKFRFKLWDGWKESGMEELSSKEESRQVCPLEKEIVRLDEPDKEGIDDLLAFLDAKTCREKMEILENMEEKLDNRILNSISASLDLAILDLSFEDRLDQVKTYLHMRIRFEDSRRI